MKSATLPQEIKVLLALSTLQFLLWSAYIVFLKPLIFEASTEQLVRAVIRVSILGVTALWYILIYKKEQLEDYLGNTHNLRFVLGWGVLGCSVIVFLFLPQLHNFRFPFDPPAWINWIIGSPLTEELYFRCIVLKELVKRYHPVLSIIGSSFLFLVFHLPQWIFTMRVQEYFFSAVMIFIYGVCFSFLWLKSRSIWTALLPHCLNNFLYMATNLIRWSPLITSNSFQKTPRLSQSRCPS